MISAEQAFTNSVTHTMQSKDWEYIENSIIWATEAGKVEIVVTFDHVPQTCLLILKRIYNYNVDKQKSEAGFHEFRIWWF